MTSRLLIVLGMHRSGTSALCSALDASGIAFGNNLIRPMEGVNDAGFWEDAGIVDINEQLLRRTGGTWYAPFPDIATVDWSAPIYDDLRDLAQDTLKSILVTGDTCAIKDPRLCLTLPFWLAVCEQLSLSFQTCVIFRAPLEISESLARRDDFPKGYGLRLYAFYRECIYKLSSADAVFVSYDELVSDASAALSALSTVLPLQLCDHTNEAVQGKMRHHWPNAKSSLLSSADKGVFDLSAYLAEVDAAYPMDSTLAEFADRLVLRGKKLATIGEQHRAALDTIEKKDEDILGLSEEHREALATIDARDRDIEQLSDQHRQALATIDERDEQIRDFDTRLSQLGEEHSHAQQVVRERDAELARIHAQLDKIRSIPGVGFFVRQILKHAQS